MRVIGCAVRSEGCSVVGLVATSAALVDHSNRGVVGGRAGGSGKKREGKEGGGRRGGVYLSEVIRA